MTLLVNYRGRSRVAVRAAYEVTTGDALRRGSVGTVPTPPPPPESMKASARQRFALVRPSRLSRLNGKGEGLTRGHGRLEKSTRYTAMQAPPRISTYECARACASVCVYKAVCIRSLVLRSTQLVVTLGVIKMSATMDRLVFHHGNVEFPSQSTDMYGIRNLFYRGSAFALYHYTPYLNLNSQSPVNPLVDQDLPMVVEVL